MRKVLFVFIVFPVIIFAQEEAEINFSNTERLNHSNTDGLLYYDLNHYPDYPEFTGGDGGGLSIYSVEDGWGALIATNNMQWLTPTFNGGYFNNKVGIGTTNPNGNLHVSSNTSGDSELLIESDTDNNNENDNPYITFRQDNGAINAHVGLIGNANTAPQGEKYPRYSDGNWLNDYPESLANYLFLGSGTSSGIQFGTNGAIRMTIRGDNGRIGIGTNNPSKNLDVNGTFKAKYNASGERNIIMESPTNSNHRGNGTQNSTGLVYRVQSNPASGDPIFQVQSSGYAVRFFAEHNGYTGAKDNSAWFGGPLTNYFKNNVAIGTTDPKGYKLAVNGKAIATEIKVKTYGTWPDYVFDKDYELKKLAEVENYINKNGHLPNIPSAEEVKQNEGIELGEMNAKLLQKIEELTLYTIEQEKQLKEQKDKNEELEKRLEKLEKIISHE